MDSPDSQLSSSEACPGQVVPHESRRSCFTCYGRKIRCDRMLPCSNCARAKAKCVYPQPEKETTSPQGRRRMLSEIIDRLSRLEETMRASNRGAGSREVPVSPHHREAEKRRGHDAVPSSKRQRIAETSDDPARAQSSWELLIGDKESPRNYFNNPVLANVFHNGDQTTELQELSFKGQPSPPCMGMRLLCGLFPPTTTAFGADILQSLQPDSIVALKLWRIYVQNVDPVFKILHIPTVQASMVEAIADPDHVDDSTHALMFAIYFAAVTSLGSEEALELFGRDCSSLLGRFEQGLDAALLRTDLLGCPELRSLQAFTIYLTCIRVHTSSRSRFIFIGIAIRLGEALGLHRDGAAFRLTPFENEIRLRLWWHLNLLDNRAPEDHGCAPSINKPQKLRYPLNVNDVDIHPDLAELPPESDGWTEMTFFLIQLETVDLMRSILLLGPLDSKDDNGISFLRSKREELENCHSWLVAKYLRKGDATRAICFTAAKHHHCACAKMRFILQIQEQQYNHKRSSAAQSGPHSAPAAPAATTTDDDPFAAACDLLETSYQLQTSKIGERFAWLHKIYTQWYALAYVLRCMCIWPDHPGVANAWDVVNRVFSTLPGQGLGSTPSSRVNSHSGIWGFLELLRQRAQSHVSTTTREDVSAAGSSNASSAPEHARNHDQHLEMMRAPSSPPAVVNSTLETRHKSQPVAGDGDESTTAVLCSTSDPMATSSKDPGGATHDGSLHVSSTGAPGTYYPGNTPHFPITSTDFNMDGMTNWLGWPGNFTYDIGHNGQSLRADPMVDLEFFQTFFPL